MLAYTTYEGGNLEPLPIKSSRQKIVKQLNRNRKNHGKNGRLEFRTHVHVPDVRFPYLVHSVFFFRKNGRLNKIWDATLNGYRNIRHYRFSTLKQRKP